MHGRGYDVSATPNRALITNPNVIILEPMKALLCRWTGPNSSNHYELDMPARLQGILAPQEYADSIERCNATLRRGKDQYYALILQMVVLVIVTILIVVGALRSSGTTRTWLIAGPVIAMIVTVIVAFMMELHYVNECMRHFKQQVVAENARYAAHPGLREAGATLHWFTEDRKWDNGRHGKEHRVYTTTQLIIEIGGSAAQGVIVPGSQQQYSQHYPQQYPSQPRHYAQYAQQLQQPQQYNGSSHTAPSYPETQASGDFRGSPWAGSAAPQYGVASPSVTCSRCGRHATLASDKFCAACGGANQTAPARA